MAQILIVDHKNAPKLVFYRKFLKKFLNWNINSIDNRLILFLFYVRVFLTS